MIVVEEGASNEDMKFTYDILHILLVYDNIRWMILTLSY